MVNYVDGAESQSRIRVELSEEGMRHLRFARLLLVAQYFEKCLALCVQTVEYFLLIERAVARTHFSDCWCALRNAAMLQQSGQYRPPQQ